MLSLANVSPGVAESGSGGVGVGAESKANTFPPRDDERLPRVGLCNQGVPPSANLPKSTEERTANHPLNNFHLAQKETASGVVPLMERASKALWCSERKTSQDILWRGQSELLSSS